MAAKRKRNNQDAAVMTDGGKPSSAGVGSDDEFADDDREPTEAVAPDGSIIKLPQKKFYRQRAHANPLADHGFDYPSCPATMNWHAYYPTFFNAPTAPGLGSTPSGIEQVEFADIGCGFGGLTIALAELFPTKVVLGMEIRHQVTAYVRDRIAALRLLKPGSFQNASVIRGNAMKFLTNFFAQGQLSKLFFCFPDPHFKSRKHKQRIISTTLLAEYAYVLRPGGIVYCITDVLDLHLWTERHFLALPDLFEPILPDSAEYQADPCVAAIRDSTEEGKKVARNNGEKYILVWRRKENPKHESAGWVL